VPLAQPTGGPVRIPAAQDYGQSGPTRYLNTFLFNSKIA
jgi:hypothetical protein